MKCKKQECPDFWASDGYVDCMCAMREHDYSFHPRENDCCIDNLIAKKQTELDKLIALRNSLVGNN